MKKFSKDDVRSVQQHLGHVEWTGPTLSEGVEASIWLEQYGDEPYRILNVVLFRRGLAEQLAFVAQKDINLREFGEAALSLVTLGDEMDYLIAQITGIAVDVDLDDLVVTMTVDIRGCAGGVLKAKVGLAQVWSWFDRVNFNEKLAA